MGELLDKARTIAEAALKRNVWEELDEPTKEILEVLCIIIEGRLDGMYEEMRQKFELWEQMLTTTREQTRRRFRDEANKRRNG